MQGSEFFWSNRILKFSDNTGITVMVAIVSIWGSMIMFYFGVLLEHTMFNLLKQRSWHQF
jgi:hypothetical protein